VAQIFNVGVHKSQAPVMVAPNILRSLVWKLFPLLPFWHTKFWGGSQNFWWFVHPCLNNYLRIHHIWEASSAEMWSC